MTLTVIAAASRLPQLRSPNLMVDGDESVLGLMAKHAAEGREFPLFFYGQHYALETVEAGLAAIAFVIFGAGAVVLKLSMLALWIPGVLFFFLAVSRVTGRARGFWITTLLIANPMWAAWSMKAGGGYLTAFAASGALVWLLVQDEGHDSASRWLLAGALTGLIYLAQPLWVPGVGPIVLVVMIHRRRALWAACYAAATMAPVLLAKLASGPDLVAWTGPAIGNHDLLGSLPGVIRQIDVFLSGSYYLSWAIDPPGPATRATTAVWCVALAAVTLAQLYRVIARRYCAASHVVFASLAATLVAPWALLSARDPRYLLPLAAPLVALAGIELGDLVDRRIVPGAVAIGATAMALLLGSMSMREFSGFNFLWTNPPNRWTEARRLQQVFGYLKVNDVNRVFCLNGMLDSQLVFYSGEQVLSRWTTPLGRYPPYVQAVDRALAAGEPVAVVGYTHTSGAPGCWDVPICSGGLENLISNPEKIFTVDGKYFVYVGANRDLLRKLGFRFWD
jgi:hypothetical protein